MPVLVAPTLVAPLAAPIASAALTVVPALLPGPGTGSSRIARTGSPVIGAILRPPAMAGTPLGFSSLPTTVERPPFAEIAPLALVPAARSPVVTFALAAVLARPACIPFVAEGPPEGAAFVPLLPIEGLPVRPLAPVLPLERFPVGSGVVLPPPVEAFFRQASLTAFLGPFAVGPALVLSFPAAAALVAPLSTIPPQVPIGTTIPRSSGGRPEALVMFGRPSKMRRSFAGFPMGERLGRGADRRTERLSVRLPGRSAILPPVRFVRPLRPAMVLFDRRLGGGFGVL